MFLTALTDHVTDHLLQRTHAQVPRGPAAGCVIAITIVQLQRVSAQLDNVSQQNRRKLGPARTCGSTLHAQQAIELHTGSLARKLACWALHHANRLNTVRHAMARAAMVW
jgi:hypothetical protein